MGVGAGGAVAAGVGVAVAVAVLRARPDALGAAGAVVNHLRVDVLFGTYTAIAGLALPGADAPIVVGTVWAGALAGIVVRLSWLDAPKWAVALPFLLVGWVAAAVMPEMLHSLGGFGFSLVLAGGLLYTVGAVVYARKRPDPWPKVFGYHEIFHACVLAALTLHLCVVAFFVLPALNHH